jgi:flagella basal body P-ring formation protein FlgA
MIALVFCGLTLSAYGGTGHLNYPMEIDPRTRTIPPEEIIRILESHLLQMNLEGRYRVEVKDLRHYEKIVLPAGQVSCEVSLPEGAHRGGYVAATLRLLSQGEEVKRLRVTARVDVYADVVVTRQYLKKHHEIREADLQVLSRNLSLLPPDVVTEVKEVLGKRATLSINSNETLRKSMVEEPPLIKKGDRVLLLVESPLFRITAMGESKEEGRRGERVKLLNLSSKREVYGRVLDSKTVAIDF